jgi:hypothetical protein
VRGSNPACFLPNKVTRERTEYKASDNNCINPARAGKWRIEGVFSWKDGWLVENSPIGGDGGDGDTDNKMLFAMILPSGGWR